MSEWNTNIDETPLGVDLWFTFREEGRLRVCKTTLGGATGSRFDLIAWKYPEQLPEPYKPPKPRQLSKEELLDIYGNATGGGSPHLMEQGLLGVALEVEVRTREIVAWEQEYGDE